MSADECVAGLISKADYLLSTTFFTLFTLYYLFLLQQDDLHLLCLNYVQFLVHTVEALNGVSLVKYVGAHY